MATAQNGITIAIDFGTARSGFVIDTGDGNKYHFVDWEDAPDQYAKNLTQILYDEECKPLAFGWTAKIKYRESLATDRKFALIKNFKMKLLTGTNAIYYGKEFQLSQLIGDYLNYIVEKILAKIDENGIADINELADININWCLTVPAIWKDEQKQFMKEILKNIIEKRNFKPNITIVPEPEAAARLIFNTKKDILNVGCTFIVLDAGGGTIDITVYRVEEGQKLSELAIGSGDAYGSIYIDKQFKKFIKNLYGKDLIRNWKSNNYECYFELESNWERTKLALKKIENNVNVKVNIPDSLVQCLKQRYGSSIPQLDRKSLILSSNDVISIFTPSFDKITRALNYSFDNVAKDDLPRLSLLPPLLGMLLDLFVCLDEKNAIDKLFLVGGYGLSSPLRDFLRERFIPRKIKEIVTFPQAASAIMDGAALVIANPMQISKRIMRQSYFAHIFPKLPNNTKPDTNILFPLIFKGEKIENVEKLTRRYLSEYENQISVEFKIVRSNCSYHPFARPTDLESIASFNFDFDLNLPLKKRKVKLILTFSQAELKVSGQCKDKVQDVIIDFTK
eukprot:TRINITY_DN611_c0_g1_i2.p1 TRINITY_DN611_c0_g1~~TRINITY_DN611_c0_g1_i2.p1  ORF type:complete len:564 (+),score=249.53 TRINITY_DN611_c0_g1_i2:153-1844(+)